MSEDMSSSGSSWNLKHLVSASHRLKGYIAPSPRSRGLEGSIGSEKKSWRAWAGQKIRGKRQGNCVENAEVINVFPGWAARRYIRARNTEAPRPFEVEVFISGYAISYRPPENITRSQRAFIRLAKGFASLPKLKEDPNDQLSGTALTPSTEALLKGVKLPPRPSEITDDFDVQVLECQLKRATTGPNSSCENHGSTSSASSSSGSISSMDLLNDPLSLESPALFQTTPTSSNSAGISGNTSTEVIKRLHSNLEQRLQPFWSSVLSNRIIRLHVLASPQCLASASSSNTNQSDKPIFDPEHGPLASQDVITGVDGSFQAKFCLGWDELCRHPQALHIAFGDDVEHEITVVAQLLPPASISAGSSASPSFSSPGTYNSSGLNTQNHNQILQHPKPIASVSVIPITSSPIRVISDVDDTIKLSNILSGARAVFHNVFVKDLKDSVIPGIGEWYTEMWSRGIRFHYVSNGPFELLPVLKEFFQISQLPPGSIKLKSYAGRSLFNGLLSAPAARKRAGVAHVLDSFPDSRFFLIGDTGEQDLELYADLARERPHMILGVLLRDVDSGNAGREPIDDPTGLGAMGAAGTRPSEEPLLPIRSDSTAKNTSRGDGTPSISSSSSLNTQFGFMSNAHLELLDERKGQEGNKTISEQEGRRNYNTFKGNGGAFEGEGTLLGGGKLSAEPESLTMDSVENSSLSMRFGGNSTSNTRSQSYPLEFRPPPPSQPQYVTQTPKATQTPRITANFIPKFRPSLSSQSLPRIYRQQQQQQQGSSLKSWSTTSFSLDSSTINYGGANGGKMTEVEKKRYELQMRVYRARMQMPSHIPLRVFREPNECVEVEEVMRRELSPD